MKEAIQQDTLQALVSASAMRDIAVRHGTGWALQGRLGGIVTTCDFKTRVHQELGYPDCNWALL